MSDKDLELLSEMKSNCLNGEFYIDPKAEEKYILLRKLEIMATSYYLNITNDIEITSAKISNCSDEELGMSLVDHLETLKAIKSKLDNNDF